MVIFMESRCIHKSPPRLPDAEQMKQSFGGARVLCVWAWRWQRFRYLRMPRASVRADPQAHFFLNTVGLEIRQKRNSPDERIEKQREERARTRLATLDWFSFSHIWYKNNTNQITICYHLSGRNVWCLRWTTCRSQTSFLFQRLISVKALQSLSSVFQNFSQQGKQIS